MKAVGALLFFAAQALQFTVTDGRGKETSNVTLTAGEPDADGWQTVTIARTKGKGDFVLIWPFDGLAKTPEGPEGVPAVVIQKGDAKALANNATVARMATPVALGMATVDDVAARTGYAADALRMRFAELQTAPDPYQKGLGLLYANKTADAVEPLAQALRERQRQLTRVPSEIYPAAMLDGLALLRAGKFDDAAVAFLIAKKQRPSSELAAKSRDEALIKAGKPEAAGR